MRVDALEKQLNENTRTFYVAASDIKYGEVITEDKVRTETHLFGYPMDAFTVSEIGTTAAVDIPANTLILKSMCVEGKKGISEREVEYSCFYVGQNISVGDYIDVRIRFQTGEDFVILSKKKVERLSLTNATCFLMVNEMEIQRMASAIVDTVEYDAVMYCNVYPQPELQNAAVINYPVREESSSLMSALSASVGIEYIDTKAARVTLETNLQKHKTGGGSVIDISNLSGYGSDTKSNTNDKGSSITSDYTEDEESKEEVE